MKRQKPNLVQYPRFKELHEDIRLCQEMSRVAKEPSCMVLEGVTGAGKTTLAEAYAKAFPRRYTETKTIIPVLYMPTPAPLTVKGMATSLLVELGDPAAHRGTLWAKNERLTHFIKACEIELIILDDFHHMIDKDTNRILAQVSEWLKNLIKSTDIPYLVIGIESSVDRILRANAQLSRLFTVREVLKPFVWDYGDQTTIQTFATFISYAETSLNIKLSDELDRVQMIARIFEATNGVIGHIMKLLQFGQILAHRNNEAVLSLRHLHEAFSKGLQKHLGLQENPFSEAYVLGKNITYFPDQAHGVGNRSRRAKEKDLPLSQVLKK